MKYKCTFCAYQSDDIVSTGQHYETTHRLLLPKGMSGEHFAYYILTSRKTGSCVVCHRPTQWNEKTHKYHRICSAKCKKKYGEIKQLTNPKVQQEMLAHRKISGEYIWSTPDDSGIRPKFLYTGSYELDFIKYMDTVKHWNPTDLMMPSPILFDYNYKGQKRFYIPDAYIPSLDLIIEIKDGDPSNPNHHANMHPDIQAVNREKEKLKKAAVKKSTHNYLVIYNKEYQNFDLYLRTSNQRYLTEDINDLAEKISEAINTDVSTQIIGFIDDLSEYIKDNELESYCEVSERLNGYIKNAVESDKFETALTEAKSKVLVQDLLTVSSSKIAVNISIMDDDTDIKQKFHDPYIIYTPEYNDAFKKLMKWKKPQTLTFIGKYTDVQYDENDTRQIVLTIELPDDD